MGNIIRDEASTSQVILHRAGDGIPLPEAMSDETECYEIHGLVRFDDGHPAVIWFQPRSNIAVVAGRSFDGGLEPDVTAATELMQSIYDICRPAVEPTEMWMVAAERAGCYTEGHDDLFAFDADGDQYTICSRCGKQSYTGPYERTFYTDDVLPSDSYVRSEDLPERRAFFHCGAPILDSQGDILGTLIMYPAEYEGGTGIAFAADEFEDEPCRVTVVIDTDHIFRLISGMSAPTGRHAFFTVERPEADEYYQLIDQSEWLVSFEWGAHTVDRRVVITYPVTTDYEDDDEQPYEVQVDKAMFFIGLMALRQALQSRSRLNDEHPVA